MIHTKQSCRSPSDAPFSSSPVDSPVTDSAATPVSSRNGKNRKESGRHLSVMKAGLGKLNPFNRINNIKFNKLSTKRLDSF